MRAYAALLGPSRPTLAIECHNPPDAARPARVTRGSPTARPGPTTPWPPPLQMPLGPPALHAVPRGFADWIGSTHTHFEMVAVQSRTGLSLLPRDRSPLTSRGTARTIDTSLRDQHRLLPRAHRPERARLRRCGRRGAGAGAPGIEHSPAATRCCLRRPLPATHRPTVPSTPRCRPSLELRRSLSRFTSAAVPSARRGGRPA
jgi:hypothetical protein